MKNTPSAIEIAVSRYAASVILPPAPHTGDVPSDDEILADVKAELTAIESGDESGVAPWSTLELARAELIATQLRVIARQVRA